ncbi:sulfate permease [Nocardioides panacis]|uniref:Sulfate permease n=1 Tax=Nocardioides panacis TaxID=2849501 RepID=A0A975Y0X5_9ACTN|nr:sulfate permease [Nocardioides panacis]QWZ08779.1 sulfate permease [Nocardioides panacis]
MARRFPTPAWTVGYRRGWLRGDLLAGVTITAYLIPQVMAYAEVAGLPAVVGLWASVGALLAYAALGSSSQLSVGPESTTALMTAAAVGALATTGSHTYADLASALCLVVAALCVLGWFARLAFLAELLSRPVLVGYMSGVAALMIVSQLGKLTGIDVAAEGFWPELDYVAHHLGSAHGPTLMLGLVTLVALLVGSALLPRAPMALIGMVGAAAAVALLDLRAQGIAVIGDIPVGLPVPALPHVSLGGVLSLLPSALGVAFVAYTDNILTGRAFADRRAERVDAKRELLALGAANLASGLMHGFPVSSSGSRTAIGHAMGGRTQLTGLVTVATTVLAVLTLRPLLASFPTAALGAVVVYAAVRLVDVGEFRRLAGFRVTELLIALATTVAVLVVGVLLGVLVAIGLSVLALLGRVVRPHDAIEGFVPDLAGMHDVDDYPGAEVVPGLMVYRYDSPLFFANTEDFRRRALAAVEGAAEPVRWFVLNAEAIIDVDITAVDALESLRKDLSDKGIVFALARMKQDLRTDLARAGLLERIGEDHLFPTLPTAVEAFRRWQQDRQ